MVSLVNSHTNATRIGWHLWEIVLIFAPGLPPGSGCTSFFLAACCAFLLSVTASRACSREFIDYTSSVITDEDPLRGLLSY